MVKVKKLNENAKLPVFARKGDVCADIHAVGNYVIPPGQRALVRTGIAVAVPPGYEMQIRPRSGLAKNLGLTVLNTPGTVDQGYRGEVGVIVINHGMEPVRISENARIAQVAIREVPNVEFVEVEELDETERGEGGFGSTD